MKPPHVATPNQILPVMESSKLLPALAFGVMGQYRGWLFARHTDGQFVTVANLNPLLPKLAKDFEPIEDYSHATAPLPRMHSQLCELFADRKYTEAGTIIGQMMQRLRQLEYYAEMKEKADREFGQPHHGHGPDVG